MPYDHDNAPLLRGEPIGRFGSGADSVKYNWGHVTNDLAAVVEAANYFNANPELARGDNITVIYDMGGTPKMKRYVVTNGKRSNNTTTTIAIAVATAG